ncbi:hypothetical protein FAM09_17260 [Niastella caeni]|uniref:PA14 domain-containing protein n=1 Tax=Niastella caeni TaxID=2569763 RepID=A0A4S8HSA4_9BACT|nr:hypothetical protein [Niastella caeni]THU38418.1 hypothetical protein FAM09_17260 [Niastella caeni]
MKHRLKYQKPIAAFLLTLIGLQTLLPVTALALTSGPSQPEASSFKQAGVSDMVDLFTGNFSYNLPLMDVDGYPLNLNYSAGSGIDDEASWVGLGWSLNVGAINRQLRGIPDDMSGDMFTTEHYTKPKVTVGGRLTAKVELKGKGALKNLGVNGSFSLGVFSDNYTGIGAELGANAGISYSFAGSGAMTAGMGVGLMSNTQSGVDVTPSLSLSYKMKVADNNTVSPGISASIGYNTRGGLKGLTLGASFSVAGQKQDECTGKVKNGSANYELGGATISYNTDPITPKIQIPYRSNYGSFSFDVGGAAWLIFGGGGGTGYKSVREVKSRTISNPGYGFLYAERAKRLSNAMGDFLREKESAIMPELPNLAVPIATPDIFSYTSQGGSGQFRLYRGGSGIFFDNKAEDESTTQTLGFDAGVGGYAHGGVTYYEQSLKNTTQRWARDNNYSAQGDFQDPSLLNPNAEHVFFKQVGEKNQEDKDMVDKLMGTQPVAVNITNKTANAKFRLPGNPTPQTVSTLKKDNKQKRRTTITYLTALEASRVGLDKGITNYAPNTYNCNAPFNPASCHPLTLQQPFPRVGDYRKANHISEITVTDEGGKRSVYGIPVYNTKQTEYSFAIGDPSKYSNDAANNLTNVTMSGGKPVQDQTQQTDKYYHSDAQPGYATSWLLSAILSPDYVDLKNDGITPDDRGTAVKFNYSRTTDKFGWRSPYGQNKATIQKGLLADPDDDKASFVYGEKELWYIHSIETKTQIAYFITEDRKDALGVLDPAGQLDDTKRQKVLREIRLYSKADNTRPIKVVKLCYAYKLCPGIPNFKELGSTPEPVQGKLTLTKVFFQYGNSDKGKAHPYEFTYNGEGGDGYSLQNVTYGNLQTDRWGSYKSRQSNSNRNFALRNDEFPYTTNTQSEADEAAGLWQLSKIKLPTGGEIKVTYESDDYAYVQNKQAMEMVQPVSLIKKNSNGTTTTISSLKDANGIRVKLSGMPATLDLAKFKKDYNNGSEYLYTKLFVNLGGIDAKRDVLNDKYYDFVPCYARVTGVQKVSSDEADIIFEDINDGGVTMNPISQAAWQRLRMEYPRYAYPGYKNRILDGDAGKAIKAAVSAILNAARNLDELRRNFYKRAKDESFANNVNLSKSFVRLTKADGKKLGGGSRVKKIMISDEWSAMSGTSAATATYGQQYTYTTKNDKGVDISSGVASFEPSVGGDENPMRQPIPYVQKIKGALNNFFNLEEPFGENLFPGASVGYSLVKVQDLDATGNPDPDQKTGYVVNEFYTAKEFPVITQALSNQVNQHGPAGWYSMIGSNSVHELTFSQGYAITLNDMHGKPKATRVFNKTNEEITSTEYFYNSEQLNAGELKLKNVVNLVNEKGEIEENRIIGREIELFTDMREQETKSTGQFIGIGVDVFPLPFFGVPGFLPHWPYKENNEYKLFRSACTMKVIQYFGILDKVVKTVDGSSIATENIAYDGLTGETVITKTYNEFDRPVYTVNFPAYWLYPYMGGAYKNIGTLIPGFRTGADGSVTNFAAFMAPGDEVVDVTNGTTYWIIESGVNGNTNKVKRMVNRNGNIVANFNQTVKILRSGYRNMLTPPATSIVCLTDPIASVNGVKYVSFSKDADHTAMKVLTASATVFDEDWGVKVPCPTCPDGYTLSEDGQNCISPLIENTQYCFTLCAGGNDSQWYGNEGALIYQTSGASSGVRVRSTFWGGVTSSSTMARQATIDSSEITPQDSTTTENTSARTATTLAALPIQPDACFRANYTPNTGCCGRLINAGLWLCSNNSVTNWPPANVSEWIAFEKCVYIPEGKPYYIGFASDNYIKIYIDGVLWQELNDATSSHSYWRVKPYDFRFSGNHRIRVEFANNVGHAAVAMEIYNHNYQELIASTAVDDSHIIFSTGRDILGKNNVQVFRDARGANIPRFTRANGTLPDICELSSGSSIPVNRVVNPYVTGFKGNWRPAESKVYQVNRKYDNLFNTEPLGLNVKNAGYFESFRSFFNYNGSTWAPTTTVNQWVTANTITLYDKYGEELENKDALGRYSAASFVFRGDQPGAVASNAKNREIYAECFEDFRLNCREANVGEYCDPLFKINGNSNLSAQTTNAQAHSGNYSLSLAGNTLSLSTIVHNNKTKETAAGAKRDYLTTNGSGEYNTLAGTGIYPLGFEPEFNKKYVFSAWVLSEDPQSTSPGIDLKVNGSSITLTKKAVVEKWKQVEGTIDLTGMTQTGPFHITITPAGGTHLDDLRIHPFDAHMKTYAYDDKTLRLMAEMDENNFATFYEYDDEGNLVRVKKETERGIMTIKENRSSYKRKPPVGTQPCQECQ